jgi:flagellar M-ring protein FliF
VNLDQIIAHLKKLTTTLSAKQLVGLASVFIAVVAVVVGSAYWLATPSYTLLVGDMDAETAASVVGKLKAAKVPYQLSDGGRTVSVPVERADELRLEFSSAGLPSAGRIGFEIFDRPAFGTTEFLEHVNYRRALEGELGRTIATMSEIASARVHITMAKDSLFADQSEPAKASVVLRLKANRPLAPATARGIAGLVSASVESLRPEHVVILDTFGRSLTRPEATTASDSFQGDRQQQIERDLTTRVMALLEPVVGAGRVRVNVAAELNADLVEETVESWDPASVVRSKQTSTETSPAALMAGGVAGARANQPPALSTSTAASNPPAPTAPATANAGTGGATPGTGTPGTGTPATGTDAKPAPPVAGRSTETTNYEVGKTVRRTVSPQGQLARLSVAVILDDERVSTNAADGTTTVSTKSWDQAGIQRVHGIVAAAVGFDEARGDQITVENIPFEAPSVATDVPAPTMGEQVQDIAWRYWPAALRGLAILALASFALFGILRPLARRATAIAASAPALPAAASATARLPTVQEMEGGLEAETLAAGGNRRLPVLTKRVAKLANEEPEHLARIVRGWIAEEER